MKKLRMAILATGVVAFSMLVACSENPQLVEGQPMGTTVHRDTNPWEGEPLTFQVPYQRNDQESWNTALARRVQGQNEYIRIGD